MEINTILTIMFISVLIICFASIIIWALSKNKKVSKFFKKIADGIAEILVGGGG
jgi:hypothetical protein